MPPTGPAAARLFDDHVDAVHAVTARRVGEKLAPDVVGEVFAQAVHSWDRFEAEGGSERAFLLGVTSNVLRRHSEQEQVWLRSRPGDPVRQPVTDPLVADRPVDDGTAAAEALDAVADLSPDDRDILLLVTWDQNPAAVVAEALGLPGGTVRSSLSRVRRDLRRLGVSTEAVERARPRVSAIPGADRRRIRDSLFGLGQGDVGRTVEKRSDSGAVLSTAPTGARGSIHLGRRPPRPSIWPRVAAGFLLAAVLAVIGWRFLIVDDDDGEAETITTAATSAPTTGPPETTAPPTTVTRTGVTADAPLLLPDPDAIVEDATVAPPPRGASGALFRAVDDAMAWLVEVDGEAGSTDQTIETIGAIEVGVPDRADPPSQPRYDVVVPCGSTSLFDAPGAPVTRPDIVLLLEAMTLTGGDLAIGLPTTWSLVDEGPFVAVHRLALPVEIGGATTVVSLAQAPGGSIAQFAFAARQYAPTVFLTEPAWRRLGDPDGVVTIVWSDGDTVFEVSGTGVALTDLEQVVAGLTPAGLDDWETRFGRATVDPVDPPPECAPQPSLSVDP